MSRITLDTWSKREQLCLASAVSCSGDQNWITVSRTLKSVCGNNGNTRPADWYSQKNCAMQYGHLLETVETTKRKKRTNENSGLSSPATVTVETPTELLLRRLTEERLLEIKAQMHRDQQLYCKMQREIEALQSEETTEEQLQQMWQEIEKEQETKRIDEMKLENRMREREQRKKDVAGNWRNNSASATGRRSNMTADTTSVDMDVEDITTIIPGATSTKQPTGPAPLLTSLLVTPGASGASNNATTSPTTFTPGTPTATGAGTGSVARATAPTITSLLTSGTAAIPSQPAIIINKASDPGFMTRPISGPPVAEVAVTKSSPSQAAPTLSMLLEKNKAMTAVKANESTAKSTESETTSSQKQAAAEQESADAAATAEDAVDDWEVEEQQLLEAFKAVDDIMDEMDIDMEGVIDEDILKDVDNVVSPAETDAPPKTEVIDFEDKLDALKRDESVAESKSPAQPKAVEVVIGSSDDSNDNIPLAAVASQESKDRSQNSADDATVAEELNETITIASSSSEENNREAAAVEAAETTAKKDSAPEETTPEVPSTRETEETSQTQAAEVKAEKSETNIEAPKDDTIKTRTSEATDKTAAEAHTDIKTPLPTAASSVHDTDEESSTLTDNSSKPDEPTTRSTKSKQQVELKIEAEPRQAPTIGSGISAPAPVLARAPLLRKLPHRDRSESPMVDDDTTTTSDHSAARSSTRRRCSSTPLIDSIPNSPASSEHTDDRRETRGASKKLFLSIYATLLESKYATYFRRAFHDEHKSAEICLRPMDLPTIKRNIESGHLRNISELQRDVLLMCQNLLLIYKPQTTQHKTARLFMQECRGIKEFAAFTTTESTAPSSVTIKVEKERTPAGNKARSGSRKSQRHH